jgi:hypothetical protein
LTIEETATALGIPEGMVYAIFSRLSPMREDLSPDTDTPCEDALSFDGKRCDRTVERVMAKLDEGGYTPPPAMHKPNAVVTK